jgi:hypothetical protein
MISDVGPPIRVAFADGADLDTTRMSKEFI